MTIVDKHAQELFNDRIGAFRLTIRLRVEGSGEIAVSTDTLKKRLPEMRIELRATIRDDFGGNTVKTEDFITEIAAQFLRISSFVARDEVSHLGIPIHDGQDGIKTVRNREIGNEIHRDGRPAR